MRRCMMLALLLVGIMITNTMSQTSKGRLSIGAFGSAIKMVGGAEDRSAVRGWLGLTGRYGLSDRFVVGMEGAYGWVRPQIAGQIALGNTYPFKTILLSGMANAYYYFDNKGKLQSFVNMGLGGINWDVRNLAGNDGLFATGTSIRGGTQITASIALGIDLFLNRNLALTTHTRYHRMFNQNRDTSGLLGNVSTVGDANTGVAEFHIGLRKYFGASPDEQEPLFADSDVLAPIEEELMSDDDFDFSDDESFSDDATFEQRVDALELGSANTEASESSDMQEYVRLKSAIDELQIEIENKEVEIRSLKDKIVERRQKVNAMKSGGVIQTAEMTGNSSTSVNNQVSFSSTTETMPSTYSDGSFSLVYETAVAELNKRQYQQAISLFTQLVQNFPSHALTSNCYYWIGEAQYGLGNYQASIEALNRVLEFPLSLKKDNALLVLGQSYLQLNRNQEAREIFSRLIQEFPSSEFVVQAEDLLSKI